MPIEIDTTRVRNAADGIAKVATSIDNIDQAGRTAIATVNEAMPGSKTAALPLNQMVTTMASNAATHVKDLESKLMGAAGHHEITDADVASSFRGIEQATPLKQADLQMMASGAMPAAPPGPGIEEAGSRLVGPNTEFSIDTVGDLGTSSSVTPTPQATIDDAADQLLGGSKLDLASFKK